jgi:cell wall assembly regulator SMI1
MTDATTAKLDADFAKHPVLVAGPAEEADIASLEAAIGFSLPSDYRAFVKRYGGAIVGPYSVYGIGASDAMGDDEASAIQVTERFRAQKWPGTETALVVSMDHAGNAVTLDASGAVHRFDHDGGTTEQLASSFESFLVDWCLKA